MLSRRLINPCVSSRLLRLALGAAATALPIGCDIAPKGPKPASSPARSAWPFIPVKLEVHPLTRLQPATSAEDLGTVQAHIFFRDPAGDEVKGIGGLLIELIDDSAGPIIGVGQGKQLMVWRVDLADLEMNRRSFDPVTRTYRLDLKEVPLFTEDASSLVLRVTLATPEGKQISGERRLGNQN